MKAEALGALNDDAKVFLYRGAMSAPKAQWAIERRRQRKQKTKRERGGNLRSVLFVFWNRIVFADLRCTITGKISYAVSRCFSFMVSQEECGSHVAAVLDDD